MTDGEYDILHEYIENKFPKNQILGDVGAPVEKNKARLPYEMWSMDKIKPDSGTLDKWKNKYTGPYVISCKLDGVSGLYTTEGPEPKLYTRGDGKIGQDISYLIPYLRLPKDKDIVIRGEFIIKRQVFDTKYKEKFANPRNLVAGIANAKTVDDKIRDVDFVAYEMIKPENLTPSQQMAKLASFGGIIGGIMGTSLIAVQNKTITEISNETLSEILQDWRKSSPYEIDGIIVSDDRVYSRASGNPDHSFAFKMVLSDQMAETHVVDVIWNASKDGYLKPRVQVMPIKLGGVTIQYATGFNADFIEKNKIGVGAVIQIIRSGDVIPYIKSVTTPAENPKMPDEAYRWNDTHVDIILENIGDNVTVREKQISAFFKGIEVDGLGPGNVKKMIASGFDTVPKILRMTEVDLLKVEGFQQKTAKKLYDGIQKKIDDASLATLMSASQKFGRGFGLTKIELVLEKYPQVLNPQERNIKVLSAIPGIGDKTATEFVERIPVFLEFMKECGLEEKITNKISKLSPTNIPPTPSRMSNDVVIDTIHPLYGKTIVMTGFRDKELEAIIKQKGAKVSSNVKKDILALLIKDRRSQQLTTENEVQNRLVNSVDENQTSGKLKEARDKNIPIMTVTEFREKYQV
jgi:NAD-dependent DNA ligase